MYLEWFKSYIPPVANIPILSVCRRLIAHKPAMDSVLKLIRVISENKRIHTPSLSSPFKVGVCCFLWVARTVAQHCMEGMGEEKLFFPLLKSVKRKNAQFQGEVSQLILSPIVAY